MQDRETRRGIETTSLNGKTLPFVEADSTPIFGVHRQSKPAGRPHSRCSDERACGTLALMFHCDDELINGAVRIDSDEADRLAGFNRDDKLSVIGFQRAMTVGR